MTQRRPAAPEGQRYCSGCATFHPWTDAYFGRRAITRSDGRPSMYPEGWALTCKASHNKITKRERMRHPRRLTRKSRANYERRHTDPTMYAHDIAVRRQYFAKKRADDFLARARAIMNVVAAYRGVSVQEVRTRLHCLYPSEVARAQTTHPVHAENDWTLMLVLVLLKRYTPYALVDLCALIGDTCPVNVQQCIERANRMMALRGYQRSALGMQVADLADHLFERDRNGAVYLRGTVYRPNVQEATA